MLSDACINLMGFRVQVMKMCTFSYFDWDKTARKMVKANPYIFINQCFGCIVVLFFPTFLSLHLYLTLHSPDKDDNGQEIQIAREEYAAIAITWGELSIAIGFFGLSVVCTQSWKEIIYTFNQLLVYNKRILDMLKEREIELDRDHLKFIRRHEMLMFLIDFWTILLPWGLALVPFHPMEPCHIIIKSWLEIDFSPRAELIPWIVLFTTGIFGAANLLVMVAFLASTTYQLLTPILNDLTPQRVSRRNGNRILIETNYYGVMEDDQVIQIYREVRLLNNFVNNILGSFWMSLHQVGCLGTAVTLLYFAIRLHQVILDDGVVAVLVVGGSIAAPLLVVWFQSSMFGTLIDASDQFMSFGKRYVPRKTLYYKFVRSCQIFYLEEAYPFFRIGRDTCLSFYAQVVDNTITLLVSLP